MIKLKKLFISKNLIKIAFNTTPKKMWARRPLSGKFKHFKIIFFNIKLFIIEVHEINKRDNYTD